MTDSILKSSKVLKIYISNYEEVEVLRRMEELGYRYKSEYIRDVMLNNFPYKNLFKSVAFEINKVGNNLNQIAKYANTEKQLDKDVLTALLKIDVELSKILFMIKDNTK